MASLHKIIYMQPRDTFGFMTPSPDTSLTAPTHNVFSCTRVFDYKGPPQSTPNFFKHYFDSFHSFL